MNIMTRTSVSIALASSLAIAISGFALLWSESVLAQSDVNRGQSSQNSGGAKATQSPPNKAAKKTTVNFEDQLIEGQAQKPELFYLLQQRNNNFKRLIKLRENFLPEMRKTSEDVTRKGSGN
jgi:hypothetical protein